MGGSACHFKTSVGKHVGTGKTIVYHVTDNMHSRLDHTLHIVQLFVSMSHT